jgi:hypothetical protein
MAEMNYESFRSAAQLHCDRKNIVNTDRYEVTVSVPEHVWFTLQSHPYHIAQNREIPYSRQVACWIARSSVTTVNAMLQEMSRSWPETRSGAENRPRTRSQENRTSENAFVSTFPFSNPYISRWCEENEQESTWRTRRNFLSPFRNKVSNTQVRRCFQGYHIPVHWKPQHVFAHSRPVPERWRRMSRIHPRGTIHTLGTRPNHVNILCNQPKRSKGCTTKTMKLPLAERWPISLEITWDKQISSKDILSGNFHALSNSNTCIVDPRFKRLHRGRVDGPCLGLVPDSIYK